MKKYQILFLLVGMSLQSLLAQNQSKPNILFIMADDLTKYDIEPYGSVNAITPTMNALAAQGLKLNNVYQASPMCSPTRHNLLTGIYPVRSGAYPNHTFAKKGTKSVVHYLRPLGYRVALSGKRHILPKDVFDFEYLDGEEPGEHDPEMDKVEAFFKDAADSKDPFCLYMNFKSPHAPYTFGDKSLFKAEDIKLPPNIADTPETRKRYVGYLAEINYLDTQLKQTLELLEASGLADNTLIMFCTEQGNSFPFAKWTLYNAGVTSGILVKWPGKVKPETESDALIEFSDILPTFIEIAGGDQPEGLDGQSILPVLLGQKESHKEYTYSLQTTRTIYSGAEYYPSRAVSNGEYRLIINLTPEAQFQNTVVKGDNYFKNWAKSDNPEAVKFYNAYINRPPIELYNDQEDPYNLNNLAEDSKYAKLISQLRKKLDEWMIYCGDEGLVTELEADEHTNGKDYRIDKVSKYMPLLPSMLDGNFEVPKQGYYSFYSKESGSIEVDGKQLYFGEVERENYSDYVVVHLDAGKHKLTNSQSLRLSWSGPDQSRSVFPADK